MRAAVAFSLDMSATGFRTRDEAHYAALDGLRGIAAVIVVLSHASNAQMYLLPGLNLSGTGRMGVWLFFALSAFLLTEQALRAARRAGYAAWSAEFLLRRFFRIFPLFVVALLLDYALNRLELVDVVRAALLVRAYGIFWTIPPEFQYYFVIPLVALALALPHGRGLYLCAALVALSLLISVPLAVWPYLTLLVSGSLLVVLKQQHPATALALARLWPLGVAAAILMAPAVARQWMPLVAAAFGEAEADSDRLALVPRTFHYVFVLVWGPVILACAFGLRATRVLASRALRYLGAISFGVYLFHPVVIAGLKHAGFAGTQLGGVVALAGTLAVAAALHHALEEPARRHGYALAPCLLGRLAERAPPKAAGVATPAKLSDT